MSKHFRKQHIYRADPQSSDASSSLFYNNTSDAQRSFYCFAKFVKEFQQNLKNVTFLSWSELYNSNMK